VASAIKMLTSRIDPSRAIRSGSFAPWDARAAHRLRPNLARHARQVWRYLDSLIPELEAGELVGVQAALVYPRRPSLSGRAELVEGVLWGAGNLGAVL
jgi:ferric-dicitrate binding protein FerR (iron transport regulator)